jgi:hypothetical protein
MVDYKTEKYAKISGIPGAAITSGTVPTARITRSNIVDAGTEGTKIAVGTTAQRGSTAGQFRYNSTIGKFEGRNASSFVSLEATPTITSIDDTEVDSAAGGNQTIVITGTNFTTGDVASFVGTSASFNAATTTIDSATQITAVAPKSSFLNAQEPYGVRVTSTGGLAGNLTSQINVDNAPTWTTASGNIATITEYATGNHATVAASDAEGDTVAYTETGGTVLATNNLTLNSSTGVISGDPTDVASDTTHTFTLRATAGSKTADRSFNIVVTNEAPLETNANTLAFFDFASGRSYDSSSTLQDLSGNNKDLPLGDASYNSANGGIIIGSTTENTRSTGLTGSITEISMGCWVKITNDNNKGIIWYGNTSADDHFFIRNALQGSNYGLDIGKDINGTDNWNQSQKDGSTSASSYITGLSNYTSKYFYIVFRCDSSGQISFSIDKSTFYNQQDAGVNMSGHSAGAFGIFGDPYNDNSSSHSIGVAWWYNGVVSQILSDAIYDDYATRFGR